MRAHDRRSQSLFKGGLLQAHRAPNASHLGAVDDDNRLGRARRDELLAEQRALAALEHRARRAATAATGFSAHDRVGAADRDVERRVRVVDRNRRHAERAQPLVRRGGRRYRMDRGEAAVGEPRGEPLGRRERGRAGAEPDDHA